LKITLQQAAGIALAIVVQVILLEIKRVVIVKS
jgi:hypothetical protein